MNPRNNVTANTPPRFAYKVEQRTRELRGQIEEFEKCTDDEALRRVFYRALIEALAAGDETMFMFVAHYEKDVLRGRDESFNHSGPSEQVKREAAERVRALMAADPSIRKGAAQVQVGKEVGRSRATIDGWMKDYP